MGSTPSLFTFPTFHLCFRLRFVLKRPNLWFEMVENGSVHIYSKCKGGVFDSLNYMHSPLSKEIKCNHTLAVVNQV